MDIYQKVKKNYMIRNTFQKIAINLTHEAHYDPV